MTEPTSGPVPGPVWRVKGDPLAGPTGSGPLDGLRVAVKDLIALAGHPRGAGNPTWLAEAEPSTMDAPVVASLRAAGATVAGLAQTDELAYSLSGDNVHYGTPPNPAAPELVTGGSSSGPASAVALGEVEIGLGTDTGGSIRGPASCCGLYGLRPTHGALSAEGVIPLAPSFDTVGWITRDAATLRAVGQVLLPAGDAALPRHLLVPVGQGTGVGAEVAAALRATAGRVAQACAADLKLVRFPWWTEAGELLEAFRRVQAAQAWRLHGAWIEAHPGALSSDVEGRFRYGATVGEADQRRAEQLLDRWRAQLEQLLGEDGGGWLALPATGGPPHRRGADPEQRNAWRQATLRCTVPASACGLPSVALPSGVTPPVGLALVGPRGADRALLAAVAATVQS
ncbi:MAG: hypothetical protein J2P15_07645 [Micromonosporaceae bacterium]|nr:hypothetical protein [Micromonosporaceae bacterium]